MHTSTNGGHGCAECASPLVVNDLCAQLAPLNRYGFPNLGAVVADGLRALIGASRYAFDAVLTRGHAA